MPAIIRAEVSWTGPDHDILQVLDADDRWDWIVDPINGRLCLFVDEQTDRLIGIEILDFSAFDFWDEIPRPNRLWRWRDWEPMRLEELAQAVRASIGPAGGTGVGAACGGSLFRRTTRRPSS